MRNRETQENRLLGLFEAANLPFFGRVQMWVTLPQIMSLHIASHTRRISDLRKRGHIIECQKETVDGQMQTKYRLIR